MRGDQSPVTLIFREEDEMLHKRIRKLQLSMKETETKYYAETFLSNSKFSLSRDIFDMLQDLINFWYIQGFGREKDGNCRKIHRF